MSIVLFKKNHGVIAWWLYYYLLPHSQMVTGSIPNDGTMKSDTVGLDSFFVKKIIR